MQCRGKFFIFSFDVKRVVTIAGNYVQYFYEKKKKLFGKDFNQHYFYSAFLPGVKYKISLL